MMSAVQIKYALTPQTFRLYIMDSVLNSVYTIVLTFNLCAISVYVCMV